MLMSGVAPGFALKSSSGHDVSLRGLSGRYIILRLLPGVGTPEWADEERDLGTLIPQLSELEGTVVRVSPDTPDTLAQFEQEPCLIMLSDPDRAVARAYGATTAEGEIKRSTYLLDRMGTIRHVWLGVRAEGNGEEVLAALRALRAADGEVNPLIQARRAYRALSDEVVAQDALERLVEAAHLAPSCFNNQPWRFVIAQGEALEQVKAALPGANYWAKRAPAIIALASHRDLDCKLSDGRDYFLLGCGMATGMLMVQATQMGLIAHPIAGYDPVAVKEALEIPADYILVTLIVVGRPGDASTLSDKHRAIERAPRDRKPLPAVLAWNTFGDLDQTEGS